MKIHQIAARDLPDLWFQAVHDILDIGRKFTIDRGSYAGQTRLEYDYFIGHVDISVIIPIGQLTAYSVSGKQHLAVNIRFRC